MNTGLTSSGVDAGRRRRGLSLIEILVTVALLVVIILGLTAMFNQTRKAFTVGLGNVDYQDAGRTAMDLITRELEQMAPNGYGVFVPVGNYYANGLNFYADVSPTFALTARNTPPNVAWAMNSGDVTNFSMERLFFATRYNQQWSVIGYRLVESNAATGVGTLYRYSTPIFSVTNLVTTIPFNAFLADQIPINTNLERVVDGVVDFRIRTYDRNGSLIPTQIVRYNTPTPTGTFTTYTGNADLTVPPPYYWLNPNLTFGFFNTNINFSLASTGDYQYAFFSNAVPAYVEVELGILESPTLAKLQAFAGSTTSYWNYLTNHTGQVHIFRQRVTIPAADPAAYP